MMGDVHESWLMLPRFQMCKFQTHLGIDIWGILVNITLEWMPENPVDGKSTLFQVMAWCH